MSDADEARDRPCMCWSGRPVLHGGHCCLSIPDFDYADTTQVLPCGHEDEGLRLAAEAGCADGGVS